MATTLSITPPALDLPRGTDLLDQPLLNKGTAFTEQERTELGLEGLLPPHIETLDEQAVRAYEAFQKKDNDLERHIYLRALQDTNEVLFYRLIVDHIEEMIPLVYTPTVATAIEQFSHISKGSK
jgi:malate dehydrogenase (oxaloacetate-decarboxylating)